MSGRVVLTGASSFLGLHLGHAFAAAGWQVSAVHSRPLEAYGGERAERLRLLAPLVQFVRADLRDPAALASLAETAAPALWVQQAGFADNHGSPDYDLATAHDLNVMMLPPLYRALAGTGCGVIMTGSSMEYAASEQANREDDACWPDTPYGLSKLAATLLARQLALRYGVPTRVARLYIPFGDHDNPRRLLPMAMAALAAGTPVDLSPCLQKRDVVPVADVCAGFLRLAEDLPRTLFDIFNLCSGAARPLRDLLLDLARAKGADPSLLRFGAVPMRVGEPPMSYGDIARARALLGWSPTHLAARETLQQEAPPWSSSPAARS